MHLLQLILDVQALILSVDVINHVQISVVILALIERVSDLQVQQFGITTSIGIPISSLRLLLPLRLGLWGLLNLNHIVIELEDRDSSLLILVSSHGCQVRWMDALQSLGVDSMASHMTHIALAALEYVTLLAELLNEGMCLGLIEISVFILIFLTLVGVKPG